MSLTIRECFEMEAFNELINCSFDEVRAAFNTNEYFILPEQEDALFNDLTQVKTWHTEEIDKIEKYMQEEYAKNITAGIEIPEFDMPQHKIKEVETQTKRRLIKLISKYFNKEQFNLNKGKVYNLDIFKETAIETPYEMSVLLNLHKNKIYSILSIIGYYQRHYGYFLSKSDFLNICYEYSNQVYFINKKLGMEYHFINIFLADCRITPNKGRTKPIIKKYQSNKYIDIDKISLLMLIQPYLKHNTKEITKIIEIMTSGFEKYGYGATWDLIWDEIEQFISECKNKGIMKRL